MVVLFTAIILYPAKTKVILLSQKLLILNALGFDLKRKAPDQIVCY